MVPLLDSGSPFSLTNQSSYSAWRQQKLLNQPRSASELCVQVADPCALSERERAALLANCARWNMAIYQSANISEDKGIPQRIAEQLGLAQLDGNWLADDDGISRITVQDTAHAGSPGGALIPYTNRPIRWHTDGYYHPAERTIRAMILHCVRPALRGGENALLDHELAYIALRDANPQWLAALMADDAMTIPARMDEEGIARSAQSGPVFSVDPMSGMLHMRYTARTHSIEWKDDPLVRAAAKFLSDLLNSPEAPILRLRMEAGMGLVCNNVLHDRSGFDDAAEHPRLLYRARYRDRVGTNNPSVAQIQ